MSSIPGRDEVEPPGASAGETSLDIFHELSPTDQETRMCLGKFSTLSSSVVNPHWSPMRIRIQLFISMRNRSRIQGAKPMRIPTDPDPGRKKLTLYMKIYLK